eukprot:TRINITY_DN284_c0_g1_i1.p1 TRINITY_DN284_c0_g1~~TRINITY_DN284_c0_g1_i1.p1  ORF type:complete len:443 (+),score=143.72 TRINITY_DN284_c0_g1_i1:35-1363(+)
MSWWKVEELRVLCQTKNIVTTGKKKAELIDLLFTAKELGDECKKRGLKGYSNLKKEELIEFICKSKGSDIDGAKKDASKTKDPTKVKEKKEKKEEKEKVSKPPASPKKSATQTEGAEPKPKKSPTKATAASPKKAAVPKSPSKGNVTEGAAQSSPLKSSGSNIGVKKKKTKQKIKIASWNMRNFSEKAYDKRLLYVQMVISRFDLIALQELRSISVVEKILAHDMFKTWNYKISEAQGTTHHKEHYAFLWNEEYGSLLHSGQVEASGLVRPPLAGTFRFGVFDFTLLNCHFVFGSPEDRAKEIVVLSNVVKTVVASNKEEKDIIVVGDFNNPPDHPNWRCLNELGFTALFRGSGLKTTIAVNDMGNLYDNMWINEKYTGRNYTGDCKVCDIYELFMVNQTNSEAVQELKTDVSDHKPIYAEFRCDIDEDKPVYGDLANLKIK